MHAVLVFLLILIGVWVWADLTKRRPEAPFSFKRTPKWKILFRLTCVPLAVLGFWAALFQFLGAPGWLPRRGLLAVCLPCRLHRVYVGRYQLR